MRSESRCPKPMMYPAGSLRSIWSRVKYLYRFVTPENSTAVSIMIPPFLVARQRLSRLSTISSPLALEMFDAIDAHPWVGSALTGPPGQLPMVRIFERIGQQIRAPGVPDKEQWTTASALLRYILGVGGQNAATGSSLGRAASTDATSWKRCRLRGRSSIRVSTRLHAA
jgi:hypothetical protein